MAVKTSWYATDTALGINFNTTYNSVVNIAATGTQSATYDIAESMQVIAPDLLGTTRRGTDGSDWILLKASTTITQYMVVMFDDSYNANDETSAGALSGYQLALCQVQTYGGVTATSVDPTLNPVFWGAVRGYGMQVNVTGSAATGVAVNSGTTPGTITMSVTGTAIHGIVVVVSVSLLSTTPNVVECMVLYPHATLFT